MLNKIKCSPSFVLSLILLATFVSYIYSLQAGFVSWDDTVYVTDNIFIRHLSFHNLWKIFNEAILGVYSPLVTLTFAVEYYFFKLNPVVYHLDNVLLHLCVTAFVFWFGLEFGFSLLASTVAALIFGTHPMHVESVAWVSERKDVLYAFFYMLALVVYGKYLKTHRTDFYMFTIVLCFLSMLSKPMALSLPLVFCLLDWFTRREVSKKIFLEKIPHFLVVATIGLITYTYNARTLNVHPNEALLTWIWTSVFYIKKFFVPFFLVPLYELPHPISASQFSYAGSLLLFFSLMILGIYLRRNKYFLFSIFFYIVTMFFLFRFDDVIDRNIVADRFMYVPSLGFCLLLGRFFEVLIGRLDARRGLQQTIVLIGSLIFLLLFRATIHQTKIWKNNDVLWSYVIEKNPNSYFPYVSRANAYLEQGRYDLASTDTDRAIELKPDYSRAWHDKGIIFQQMGQYDLAMDYYTQALRLNPKLAVAFHNRGLLYFVKGDLDSALNDFNKSIQLDGNPFVAYASRGDVYLMKKQFDLAMGDYNQSIAINPYYSTAYCNRGALYMKRLETSKALSDFNQAVVLNPKLVNAYSNRCYLYLQTKNYTEALKDCNEAIAIDPNFVSAYHNRSLIFMAQKEYEKAKDDDARAKALSNQSITPEAIKLTP